MFCVDSVKSLLIFTAVFLQVSIKLASSSETLWSDHIFHLFTVEREDECMAVCAQTHDRCVSYRVKVVNGLMLCELSDCGLQGTIGSILKFTQDPNGEAVRYTTHQVRKARNGIDCSASLDIEARTCSDIKLRNLHTASSNYIIDPDGPGGQQPFSVFCNMTDTMGGVGVTVIGHDSEERTYVKDGTQVKGSYARDITYANANFAQLAALTRVSRYCEQFIKWECYETMFIKDGYAWWVSRDNEKMTYWGGATPGSWMCACGMNSSCSDTRLGCNCDNQVKVLQSDEGLLTDKTALPVRQLRFGDFDGAHEKGYHTLGKLKCYGNEPFIY